MPAKPYQPCCPVNVSCSVRSSRALCVLVQLHCIVRARLRLSSIWQGLARPAHNKASLADWLCLATAWQALLAPPPLSLSLLLRASLALCLSGSVCFAARLTWPDMPLVHRVAAWRAVCNWPQLPNARKRARKKESERGTENYAWQRFGHNYNILIGQTHTDAEGNVCGVERREKKEKKREAECEEESERGGGGQTCKNLIGSLACGLRLISCE